MREEIEKLAEEMWGFQRHKERRPCQQIRTDRVFFLFRRALGQIFCTDQKVGRALRRADGDLEQALLQGSQIGHITRRQDGPEQDRCQQQPRRKEADVTATEMLKGKRHGTSQHIPNAYGGRNKALLAAGLNIIG
jgi:hypothetical protein